MSPEHDCGDICGYFLTFIKLKKKKKKNGNGNLLNAV